MDFTFQDEFDINPTICLSKCTGYAKDNQICKDLLKDFFSNTENVSKVIDLLKQDGTGKEDILIIFQFFTELLRSIATSSMDHITDGLNIVKQVFTSSPKILKSLLKSEATSIAIGLKYLTRAAMISEEAATEVLDSIEWRVYNLSPVMAHTESRKWMFRFILVFLNKEACIQNFFDQELLQRSIPYLINEKDTSIEKVLTTLYEKILIKRDIPKETKATIFNAKDLAFLLPMYALTQSSEEKKQLVTKALHKLVVTIYSSVAFGIITQDNVMSYILILSAEKSLSGLSQLARLLKGAATQVPNVISLLIGHMHANLHRFETDDIASLQAILHLFVANDTQWYTNKLNFKPPECAKLRAVMASALKRECYNVKFRCLELLNLLYCRCVAEMANEDVSVCADLKFVCEVRSLLPLWKSLAAVGIEKDGIRVIEMCKTIANILHSYFEVNFDKKMSHFINIANMLKEFSTVKLNDIDAANFIHTSYFLMNLMSMARCRENQLILDISLDLPDIVSSSSLAMMCSLYIAWQAAPENILVSAGTFAAEKIFFSLITSDLSCLGIRVSESELKLWLKECSKGDQSSHFAFFLRVITEAIKLSHVYRPLLYSLQKTDEQCMEEQNFLSILNDEDNMDCMDNEDVCVIPISEPFSCLVLSAVDILRTDATVAHQVQYFSTVMQHYVHSLSSPELLTVQLLSTPEVLSSEVKGFLADFLAQHDCAQSLESANLSVRLEAIFRASVCPKIKHFVAAMPDLLTDDLDNEFICNQILYYIKTEKFKSNGQRRPKYYKFFCGVLIKLLQAWHIKGAVAPLKFLLGNAFLLDSYSPFMDSDCLNEAIVCLLLLSNQRDSLFEPMKAYCDKTIDTFSSFAFIGDIDVLAPFEIFLGSSFFTYSSLQSVVNGCSRFSVADNEHISNLLIKLIALLHELTNPEQLPDDDTVVGLTSLLLCLDNLWEKSTSRTLSELVQNLILKILPSLKSITLNPEFEKNIFACKNIISGLKCQLLSMYNISAREIAEKFISMEAVNLESEAPFIAALTTKETTDLSIKAFVRCKTSVLDWAKNIESSNSTLCEQILQHLLKISIIDSAEATEVADQWYGHVICQSKPAPCHMLNMHSIFEHLGPEYSVKFLLMCMQCVYKLYLPTTERDGLYADLIATAPGRILSLREAFNMESQKDQLKTIFKSFWKQLLKVGLTDQAHGSLYLDCLVDIIPYANKNGYNLKRMFNILCSHSRFNVVLNGSRDLKIKGSVIKLMVALLEVHPELCEEEHIPLLLTAYNASMSASDQHLLKLLQIYDRANCLTKFPPVVWGFSATDFFSSKLGSNPDFESLESDKYKQVLRLLKPHMVIKTAKCFDPSLELDVTTIVEKPLPDDIYDQRFLLRFAGFVTSRGDINWKALVASKVLTIAVAALASQVDVVWATGALILHNLREACKDTRNAKKVVWFIRILGRTLNGHKRRLPFILSQLLIEICDTIFSLNQVEDSNADLTCEFNQYLFGSPLLDMNISKQLNGNLGILHTTVRVIAYSGICKKWEWLQSVLNQLVCLGLSTSLPLKLRYGIFECLDKICSDSKPARKHLIDRRIPVILRNTEIRSLAPVEALRKSLDQMSSETCASFKVASRSGKRRRVDSAKPLKKICLDRVES